MFSDLIGKYDWVLRPVKYRSADRLLLAFKEAIIDRAWKKHQALQRKKIEQIEVLSVEDFLSEDEDLVTESCSENPPVQNSRLVHSG